MRAGSGCGHLSRLIHWEFVAPRSHGGICQGRPGTGQTFQTSEGSLDSVGLLTQKLKEIDSVFDYSQN